MIALDTETTGVDFWHGARPFLVTTCEPGKHPVYWRWDVDPYTRKVLAPAEDVDEVLGLLGRGAAATNGPGLVLHSAQFDVHALRALLADRGRRLPWPWHRTRDTLTESHVLNSAQPHDLTSLAAFYLGVDLKPFEDRLEEAVKAARRLVQAARLRAGRRVKVDRVESVRVEGSRPARVRTSRVRVGSPAEPTDRLARWRIAEDGLPDMPSAGKEAWRADGWLPRAVLAELGEGALADYVGQDCGWWGTVVQDYANADSSATVHLAGVLAGLLAERGLNRIAEFRTAMLPVFYDLKLGGVGYLPANAAELAAGYAAEAGAAAADCLEVAAGYGYPLELPRGASPNGSLRTFMLDVMGLEPVAPGKKSRTSAPTLDRSAVDHYLETLDADTREYRFVSRLVDKRKRDTAAAYLANYARYAVPHPDFPGWADLAVLHPDVNPTGTHTLRCSSSNPNEQSISRKQEECRECRGEGCTACRGTGRSLQSVRYAFGPAPGREWWSLDGKNVELRIPAYESGERELIDLFERPDDPPYYGSEHLLNFSTVYPDLWAAAVREVGLDRAGPWVKKTYESTWYKYCKCGGFAVGYGAVDRPDGLGTADRTFRRPGSQALLRQRFGMKEAYNQRWIRFAAERGYVETIPDQRVDPARGYPLACSRNEWGRVSPTVPPNYRVQGTACWVKLRGMHECYRGPLADWRRRGFDSRVVMDIHDELVFDLPARGDPRADPKRSNLARVRELARTMEACADDVGVPIPVGAEYHPRNWAEGFVVKV